MDLTEELESVLHLASLLRRIDGIGGRGAFRAALELAFNKNGVGGEVADALKQVGARVKRCAICELLTESESGICAVCSSQKRDQRQICVVASWLDAAAIERSGSYTGTYHVLGGLLSPIDGVGPSDLSIEKLVNRVKNGDVREVIIATPTTPEGEATASFIANELGGLGVELLSRIASGVPAGSSEFAKLDGATIIRALSMRRALS